MRRWLVGAVVLLGVGAASVGTAQAAPPPGIHKTGVPIVTTIINKGIIVWPGPEKT